MCCVRKRPLFGNVRKFASAVRSSSYPSTQCSQSPRQGLPFAQVSTETCSQGPCSWHMTEDQKIYKVRPSPHSDEFSARLHTFIMSSFTVSRVSLLGLIYALLTLAAPAEEHWTTSTVSSVPSSFSTFSASTPTSSPSASGSSIGSASSSTSSSTGPAPPGFHSHTTVVRSLTSTTEVPSFVTSETSFTLDFTQATPFAFTKPTIPSTLVTATRAPTGYTVKAPVYNEVCKMGLKFCEIDTVIDCDVKGECQVCATSEAGIRNCRWFKGNEFANYDST